MRARLIFVSCLLTGVSAHAADIRAIPPGAAAAAVPQTVQDAAPPVQDVNANNPFPCLFGCEPPEPVQAAVVPQAAPPDDADPEPAATRKRTRQAFAKAHATRQEGRSVAAARKVARPQTVVPQATAYQPNYGMPLSGDTPMGWQLRASPPKPGAQPATGTGPFGGLKDR